MQHTLYGRSTPSVRIKSSRSASSAVWSRSAQSPPTDKELTPSRKQNILRAAEHLFATRGFHGVSIRDIADAAGVPLALVGYYYGPKLDLYHVIYYQRAGYIEQRLESLARAQREAPAGLQLEAIIAALMLPVPQVAATPDGRLFLRLMARGINNGLAENEAIVRESRAPGAEVPGDAPTQRLDDELELGAFVGRGNCRGDPIPIDAAGAAPGQELHHHGLALDRHAGGLGAFALPPTLPHLHPSNEHAHHAFAIQLQAWLSTAEMGAYWSLAQWVAHRTHIGCNLKPGDLLGSGTQPVALPNGQTRRFLEDGDTLALRAWCERDGHARIGFSACHGTVLPVLP